MSVVDFPGLHTCFGCSEVDPHLVLVNAMAGVGTPQTEWEQSQKLKRNKALGYINQAKDSTYQPRPTYHITVGWTDSLTVLSFLLQCSLFLMHLLLKKR